MTTTIATTIATTATTEGFNQEDFDQHVKDALAKLTVEEALAHISQFYATPRAFRVVLNRYLHGGWSRPYTDEDLLMYARFYGANGDLEDVMDIQWNDRGAIRRFAKRGDQGLRAGGYQIVVPFERRDEIDIFNDEDFLAVERTRATCHGAAAALYVANEGEAGMAVQLEELREMLQESNRRLWEVLDNHGGWERIKRLKNADHHADRGEDQDGDHGEHNGNDLEVESTNH